MPIEIPPTPTKKCKITAIIVTLLLLGLPAVMALYFWFVFDNILIAFFLFIFLQIVSGVITSKMRSASIPFDQIDIDYTTYEIAKWYFCPKGENPSDKKMLMST